MEDEYAVLVLGDREGRLVMNLNHKIGKTKLVPAETRGLFIISLFCLPRAIQCFWASRATFTTALKDFEKAYGFKKLSHRSILGKRLYLVLKSVQFIVKACRIISADPRIVLNQIDNSVEFQLLDVILHKKIRFITIQNGNRLHASRDICGDRYEHFSNPVLFHSFLCVLSEFDIDLYKRSRANVLEYHVLGSLRADWTRRQFNRQKSGFPPLPVFDVFLVLTSNFDRDADLQVVKLIREFCKFKKIRVCVGFKYDEASISSEVRRKISVLFGDFSAVNFNRSPYPSIEVALKANVVIGTLSTLLREVLSFGKKIYPLNFGPSAFDTYFCSLGLCQRPSQNEFNEVLCSLLEEEEEDYRTRLRPSISSIGAFPQDVYPIERLSNLLWAHLNRSYLEANF